MAYNEGNDLQICRFRFVVAAKFQIGRPLHKHYELFQDCFSLAVSLIVFTKLHAGVAPAKSPNYLSVFVARRTISDLLFICWPFLLISQSRLKPCFFTTPPVLHYSLASFLFSASGLSGFNFSPF